ncbi:adhesion regulating molecule [Mycena floridula]|nr:adhesion regulating molecule [Mycena floridula]
MAETLLAFKAGRAFRRGDTNTVEPSATKGAILLTNGDDGLLHFMWKNRVTNDVEEDLILFPSDANFTKVNEASGRVYVLKFSSSNQRHFFWMQDASSARDEEFARNLDGLLQDPEYSLVWGSETSAASTSNQAASSCVTSQTAPGPMTAEQIAELSRLLTGASASQQPGISLEYILTPDIVTPLFTSHPELVPALFPHLPPDLPVPPSAEAVRSIISSPQFRESVRNLDQALRTGLLGGMVRTLGLPEEAGTGVEPFLRAIQEQADRERGSEGRMDID